MITLKRVIIKRVTIKVTIVIRITVKMLIIRNKIAQVSLNNEKV